jgi:hypothetical protein
LWTKQEASEFIHDSEKEANILANLSVGYSLGFGQDFATNWVISLKVKSLFDIYIDPEILLSKLSSQRYNEKVLIS